MQNNATTDSYDSEIAPYGPANQARNGGVCSAGPVTLASGADVLGNVQGTSVSQFQGGGTSIAGSVLEVPIPDVFEPVDFSSVGSNNNLDIERGPVWAPPFYNSSTRDLVVNNGRNLTLQSGTYHFRNMFLAGGSTLTIDGDVEIFIEQEMRFDNGTVANLDQRPENFRLNVGAGPVNVQGGHNLHAVIYAPEATVEVANGTGFFGSIVGRTLTFAGGGGLHFDESLIEDNREPGPSKLVF